MKLEHLNTDELLDFIDGKLPQQRSLAIQQYVLEHPVYISVINGLLAQKADFPDSEALKKYLKEQAEQACQKCLKQLGL